MQIVIDIPEGTFESVKRYYEQNQECYALCAHVASGKPLPKGHGRLIDADAFERRCMFDSDIEDMQDVIYALRDYKSIIEADMESEAQV